MYCSLVVGLATLKLPTYLIIHAFPTLLQFPVNSNGHEVNSAMPIFGVPGASEVDYIGEVLLYFWYSKGG